MKKLEGRSMDIVQDNIEKLKEIFPEVFTEGKVDFTVLKHLLGEKIEDSKERYSFTWKGKTEARQVAQQVSTGTLRPYREESKNWDDTENLYIEGDNLEVLKLMQKSYHGKIKMIYIDPPYNTGNDFIYRDNFRDSVQNYLELTGQVCENSTGGGYSLTTNKETNGRYHSDWLNMMYPRLKLARNLLADDGVIFISIDDNEQANLKKICDEIFGDGNFVANLIWQKKFSRANDAKYFSTMHDYILCFCKKSNLYAEDGWEIGLLPRKEKIPVGYSNPDNDPKGVWTSVVFSAKSGSDKLLYEITTPSGRKVIPPSGRYWSVNKEKFEQLVLENKIWFGKDGNGTPRLKTYLSEVQNGLRPNTIIFHDEGGHNQQGKQETKELFDDIGVFDGPKPVKLLNYLLTISNLQKDSIILDFFSGSATTAHAVMKLNAEDGGNRRYIMVQLPEPCDEKSEAYKAGYKNICEIGKERIRRAGDMIKDELQKENAQLKLGEESKKLPDTGFKVFKLDSSNIKEWDSEAEDLKQTLYASIENIKSDRTSLDILYEVLLKYGLDLNVPIVEHDHFYSIGGGTILINLDKEINMDVINSICEEYQNLLEIDEDFKTMVVLRDSAFENDEDKTNMMTRLEQIGIKEVRSI